ncbi:uncharacterized protein [Musca autumnalis]|uniref:uncharacterized protein n=1 Tax=Musca autumnalis TaxID=221902 RepID=UPI003CE80776
MPKSKSGIKRPIMNIEGINAAILDIEKGMTIEMAAKKNMIAKTTLWRHYKKRKLQIGASTTTSAAVVVPNVVPNITAIASTNNNNNKQVDAGCVFSNEEEIFLAEYIKTLAQLKCDLNRNDVMKFAYVIAQKNQKPIPATWSANYAADDVWLNGFLQRHPNIPIEKIEENTIQKAKECLSLLLFNQIFNYLNMTVNNGNSSANSSKSKKE